MNFVEDILERPHTFWQTIREFWKTGKAGIALFLISVFVLIYGYIAYNYEIGRGWNGHESVQNVTKDISAFVPVGGTLVAMIIGGIDLMMLLADFIQARREKRIEAAKAIAKAEGKAEERQIWIDWNNRRLEAEAKGEPFNENPPAEPEVTNKQ